MGCAPAPASRRRMLSPGRRRYVTRSRVVSITPSPSRSRWSTTRVGSATTRAAIPAEAGSYPASRSSRAIRSNATRTACCASTRRVPHAEAASPDWSMPSVAAMRRAVRDMATSISASECPRSPIRVSMTHPRPRRVSSSTSRSRDRRRRDTYPLGAGAAVAVSGHGGTKDQVEGQPHRSREGQEEDGQEDHQGDAAPEGAVPRGMRPGEDDHDHEADDEEDLSRDQIEEYGAEVIALLAAVEAQAAGRTALAEIEPVLERTGAAAVGTA